MDLGFRGEVTAFYQRYRHGYPPEVVDALVDGCGLTSEDVVLDLGCGTGQLTLPVAERVHAAAGIDPEPDMLTRAREEAGLHGAATVNWLLGADSDLAAIGALFGDRRVGAVTVAQALHWMDHEALFRTAFGLLRPGGAVAVVANGTPLWLQDSAWSAALRGCLEQWLGKRLTSACGTDEASRSRYAAGLAAAGYSVSTSLVEYFGELTLDGIVGGVYSALPADLLPGQDERAVLAERIRHAVEPHAPYRERVPVSLVIGRVPR